MERRTFISDLPYDICNVLSSIHCVHHSAENSWCYHIITFVMVAKQDVSDNFKVSCERAR